jgi:hypothetical protein
LAYFRKEERVSPERKGERQRKVTNAIGGCVVITVGVRVRFSQSHLAELRLRLREEALFPCPSSAFRLLRRKESEAHLQEEERMVLDGLEELLENELDEFPKIRHRSFLRLCDVRVVEHALEELEDGRLCERPYLRHQLRPPRKATGRRRSQVENAP